jgi:predicted secreted Zn-dependent protease
MWTRASGWRIGVLVIAAGLSVIATATGEAGVRSSTEFRAYRVGGTTAGGLVSYMRRKPFPGDNGPAVANIRPHYTLSVDTTFGDAVCSVKDIDLNIAFVMTLPRARAPGAFSPATRSAWNGFVDFATRHEETHRTIYVDCASDFTAKASALVAANCAKLRGDIDAMFKTANRACERRQLAFDRGEYRKVLRLSLFRSPKYAKRKVSPLPHRFGSSSAMGAPAR